MPSSREEALKYRNVPIDFRKYRKGGIGARSSCCFTGGMVRKLLVEMTRDVPRKQGASGVRGQETM